ncbi:hypothetical protein DKM44_05980 [Deinococcus irradiatisoli]|uniref:DUF4430 domain-containing protein n=1 Tax=Deinococcus irradiatisoli TaxID=2202254 RepID=A0A2Z3JMA1_9DEIO|nr:hypothetical protein [Deinococcus irradiatisoli]AWN22828.1 hypothetical protein DKM44_05980 [Deinococcus irradiatisoli]
MKNKLSFFLVTAALCLTPFAAATDAVTVSNLTGLKLPAGAIEVTDEKATTPFNQYLVDVAEQMGGDCEYSEFLVWLKGDPKDIANKLAGPIVSAGYQVEDLDAGDIDSSSTYEEFAMTSKKDNYAGVWVDGPDGVVLGWCNVKK